MPNLLVDRLIFSARQHYMLSALCATARPFDTRVDQSTTVEVRVIKFSLRMRLALRKLRVRKNCDATTTSCPNFELILSLS